MHRPGHRLARGERAHFHRGHHVDAACNFGVTTPLWDRFFGSRYLPARDRAGERR
jgi:sterol desaturase/sphingolipid hydroxylase (fatty acid hydroxylase superfamily)